MLLNDDQRRRLAVKGKILGRKLLDQICTLFTPDTILRWHRKLIAAKWATNRRVPQVAFKPDWSKHAKAAPFKRNDLMLTMMPIGVIVFPGTGIQDNLADKARRMGIPVWKFGDGGA